VTTHLITSPLGNSTSAVAWVKRSFELMACGELEDFQSEVHAEATNREALAEPPECRRLGPDGSYATALWLRSMFSDLHWDVHEVLAQGNLVATHATMTGRHTGTYTKYNADGELTLSRPATGRSFATTQSHWFRHADGLTIEHWANRDDLGMATQLGFLGPVP
jgi:hypothetical protein